jgi:hypothetical protein
MKKAKPNPKAALDAIAARLKAGDLYEDVVEDLDALLGTEMAPRDRDLEGQFQEWSEEVKEASEDAGLGPAPTLPDFVDPAEEGVG